MNDSQQSLDVFSQHSGSPQISLIIADEDHYISLMSDIKKTTYFIEQDGREVNLTQVNCKIKDFKTCILLGLSLIKELLEVENVEKIIHYLEDSIAILQMLRNLIRNLTQVMSCRSMKGFPMVIGEIIQNVFIHCRESETQYGKHLCVVEKQLKELFVNCQELQFVYLTILEKDFIFVLTEDEDMQILVEAININLKIGEVVTSLSVKTMAEQWKSYTQICEKYSDYLLDKNIYDMSLRSLCTFILDNINTAMTENHDHKLMLRSIKVAKFLLNILMKVYQIFKHCVNKNFLKIINLFCCIKMHCKEYLEEQGRSPQLIDTFDANISVVLDNFIIEVLLNEEFLHELNNFEKSNDLKCENLLSGYIILLITVMKQITQRDDCQIIVSKYSLERIMVNVFNILHSDYKHLLLKSNIINKVVYNCVALISCFNQKQFSIIERYLYEGVMNSDSFVAMFSSHLWVALMRLCSPKLRHEHLIFLCKTYMKLSDNNLFCSSPQRIHLTSTIERIFALMPDDERTRFSSHFVIDDTNLAMWSVLQVNNLPLDQCKQYTKVIYKKLKIELKKFLSGNYNSDKGINYFLLLLKAISTCPLNETEIPLKEDILKTWTKLCKINMEGNEIFIQYLSALATIVGILASNGSFRNKDFNKILHIITSMEANPTKLIAFNLLFKLSVNIKSESLNSILSDFVQNLTIAEDEISNYIYNYLATNAVHSIHKTILESIRIDNNYEAFEDNNSTSFTEIRFIHKCPEIKSNNFDIADVDTLFQDSDEEEPAPKKTKSNETDIVLNKIEENTELLCNLRKHLSSEHCNRINTVCNKLKEFRKQPLIVYGPQCRS